MSKAYIAAPFFNSKQLEIVETIKQTLEQLDIGYFSPKDESMFKQGDDPVKILDLNCAAIKSSDFIIVVTDDKDVGTIWEAGYAHAKYIPILYVWLGYQPHMKFNIMLAASGEAVVRTYGELKSQLEYYKKFQSFKTQSHKDMLHE